MTIDRMARRAMSRSFSLNYEKQPASRDKKAQNVRFERTVACTCGALEKKGSPGVPKATFMFIQYSWSMHTCFSADVELMASP